MKTQLELKFLVHKKKKKKGKDRRRLGLRLNPYSTREYQRERGETSFFFLSFLLIIAPFYRRLRDYFLARIIP